MTNSKRNSSRGFTLVELLVVIGIIAILVAVSMPALNSAMTHARTAKCSANLRSIGAAMLTFAGDNNNNMPLSGDAIPYNQAGTGALAWTQQLEPYLGIGSSKEDPSGRSIYQCPDRANIASNKYYSYFNGAHAAYAQTGGFAALNLMRIHSPSAYIISGDITSGTFGLDDADKDDFTVDAPFNGYTVALANSGTKSPITIHGGSVNLVFADGHVENARSFDNIRMTTVYQGPGSAYPYLYSNPQ